MTHRKIEKGSKTRANRDNDISCTETHTQKIHTMKKKEQKYIHNQNKNKHTVRKRQKH